MTTIHQFPQSDARHDEAAVWVAKLSETLSPNDEKALREWIASDPGNRAVLHKMTSLWDRMDSLSRLSSLFPESPTQHSAVQRFAVAASMTLAVGVSVWILLGPPAADTELESDAPIEFTSAAYETAVGEHSRVMLPDGSELVLNTNSLVIVQYSKEQRLLLLERGELHVRVAENKQRLLSVIAGTNVVQAVGTEFNVEITSDDRIELVVTEGKVRIGVQPSNSVTEPIGDDEPPLIKLLPSAMTIMAGEELILGTPHEEVTQISDFDIEVRLSWQNGNLIFRGESLEEAIEEVTRYTSVKFVLLDENLKKTRVAGMFRTGDVDSLLAALQANFNIEHERLDDERVLLTNSVL